MQNFWPSSGFDQLQRNAKGWLVPTESYFRLYLIRPELAPVNESCAAERELHAALWSAPLRPVSAGELAELLDPDAVESYAHFLRFRDALLAAGSLEAYYLAIFRAGVIDVPPLFVDLIGQAILRNVLNDSSDAYEVRAGEMLFRPQRVSNDAGQMLAGDQASLDMLNETGGLGDMGRLLAQAQAPLRTLNMQVLNDANALDYWQAGERYNFLLDLTHEINNELGHSLVFTMTRARSGLKALARVLEKWVRHFLGVAVSIKPLQKIDDPAWRWHIGLDKEASALLNDLYEDRPVAPERMLRLVSLFRLDFVDPQEMRADVVGKPVYLGMMMNAGKLLRLKPQNLLLNLPLASRLH